MKKVLFAMAMALLCIPAVKADKVSSTSRIVTVIEPEKEPWTAESNFLVKVGAGAIASGDNEVNFSYNAALGYQRQFNRQGAYWGAQIGLMQNAYEEVHYPYDIYNALSLYLGPTVGLKKHLGVNTQFDGHVGAGYLRTFDSDAYQANSIKWELGLGIWYKRFLIELQYDGSFASNSITNNGVLLNLGYKF